MPTAKITETTVLTTHCPEGANKVTLFDTHLTGFICEITRAGNRTYALRYKNQFGRQKQLKLGNASDLTCDQARKLAKKAKARILMGEDPAEERQITRRIPTIEELADKYLDYVRTYKRSHDIDERYLRNHVLPKWGKRHLNELKQQEVLDWLESKVKDDGYSEATTNRWHVILSHMYKMAKRWNLPGAENNPLDGVPLKRLDNMVERFLSKEETQRLLEAVDASPNTQLGPIVRMLLLTGCRKREILDLKWSEVDLDKMVLKLSGERTKTAKARLVTLSDEAVEVLKNARRWDQCDYVFPNPATLEPYTSIFHSWDRARKAAGLPDVRLHDCRHSYASWLAEAGYSILIISKALGHSSTRTTERYAHVGDETLRNASNAAAGMLRADVVTAT
jgi:integrase